MSYQVFDNEDNTYLQWMHDYPSGLVLNAWRSQKNAELVLHKSGCHHIATIASLTKGAYTERDAIKIASTDLTELENWAREHRVGHTVPFKECKTCNPLHEGIGRGPVVLFPDNIEDPEQHREGAKLQVWVNFYERDPKARQKCLTKHGYLCKICEFDFVKEYGPIGEYFIHVHHLRPLHTLEGPYIVDPINDLVPVCPNCHAMLHQRKDCYSIEELKEKRNAALGIQLSNPLP